MIKVSTIVAVRNAGESLYECVQTLLEQTLPDTEILLVDDASEDVTPEVIGDCCAQFPEDIRGAYLETPAGLGGGRNRPANGPGGIRGFFRAGGPGRPGVAGDPV